MTKRGLLTLLLLCPTPGCYSYVDTSIEAIAPGSEVRVSVTSETADRLRDALAQDERSVEGRVQAQQDAGLLLEVVTATRQVGFRFEPLRQTIRLEPADVTSVQQKSFDRKRTVLTVSMLSVVAAAVAWTAIRGWTGGNGREFEPNPPADDRVIGAFFRVPLRFP